MQYGNNQKVECEVLMACLTQSEMEFISTLQQKVEANNITKHSIFAMTTEDQKKLIEQTKTFWEYIEKKYNVRLQEISHIAPSGEIVLK